jgi:hypothetical protein
MVQKIENLDLFKWLRCGFDSIDPEKHMKVTLNKNRKRERAEALKVVKSGKVYNQQKKWKKKKIKLYI